MDRAIHIGDSMHWVRTIKGTPPGVHMGQERVVLLHLSCHLLFAPPALVFNIGFLHLGPCILLEGVEHMWQAFVSHLVCADLGHTQALMCLVLVLLFGQCALDRGHLVLVFCEDGAWVACNVLHVLHV